MRYQVSISSDARELARQCKAWLVDSITAHQAVTDQPFTLALAGGSTPKLLYQLLAEGVGSDGIDWNRMVLIWGDERNVPSNHADSNYRMVNEVLLGSGMVPEAQILAVPNPGADANQVAEEYEHLLRNRLSCSKGSFPQIDCVLLGLGEDVHTASLFPETEALKERQRWVVANYVPKLNAWRITLTLPLINAARRIAFLVAGRSKTVALQRLWEGPDDGRLFPAQLIAPSTGSIQMFVDRDALGSLTTPL